MPPRSGNRLVDLTQVIIVVQEMATCKTCHDADMHAFFNFCDKKIEAVKEDAKQKYSRKYRLKSILQSINVRKWYKEWQEENKCCNITSSLTINEVTYGLASNISVSCKRCNKNGNVCEAKDFHCTTKRNI